MSASPLSAPNSTALNPLLPCSQPLLPCSQPPSRGRLSLPLSAPTPLLSAPVSGALAERSTHDFPTAP